ncbi:M15 family metallopeptidase [Rugosimonospora africana]|uniref:Peptidase M15C domain-containing protein n=1 Tax=Rugosimonospora africana TaxID=556532 RepID=A0A8J3VS55_9ACTN|nr:M15 family metallopeptidase [Rugosimonospora africana]GIH16915.1 hypothetical protein Raf01_50870 [Rugosimonospora africana]
MVAAWRIRRILPAVVALAAVAVVGCSGDAQPPVRPSVAIGASPGASGTPTSTAVPTGPLPSSAPGATPSFIATVATLTAADVPHTWHSGCPVAPADLRLMHLSFWGFDKRPHIGTMVVNASVTGDVMKIFSVLYQQQFPIRRMQPEDAFNGSDADSMAADNTSGFNCPAGSSGAGHSSEHALGKAIDVNPVENPDASGKNPMPPAGKDFLNRSDLRPGMAVPNGVLVKAFTAAGWVWSGPSASGPNYQHFSTNGR